MRDAIVAAVAGKSTCGAITSTDLEGISRLGIFNKTSLTALKAGDFVGLTGLTNLTLNDNSLGSLPAGVFDALTSLRELDLYGTGSFGSLPAGVFDKLTSLRKLDVGNLGLSGLSAGVFDKLTELTSLKLYWNSLGSLPAGVFDKLTTLTTLSLTNNTALSCLPFIPSSVTTLQLSKDKSAFSACGAGVTVSASSTGVSAGPDSTATYTVVLDAYPTGNVTVTPASSAASTATVSGALTFAQGNWSTSQTVTVTGVAVGSATVSHTVAGGGYGSATAADVAVTVANQAPSAPTSLTATSGDASVALSWTSGGNGGSPITKWEYARKEGNNAFGSWTDICVTSGNAGCPSTTSHTLSGLTNGTAYTFRVRAVNAIGNGAAAESSAVRPSSVCRRTPEVRDAIVAAVAGKSTCGAITSTDLAGISRLGIFNKTSLTALKAGDFAGLTGLTNLALNNNSLGSLPAGVFDALTSLRELDLYNNSSVGSLPAGVFDKLTSLQKLDVGSLGLSSLSAGVFDKLTELTELKLYWNSLSSLPVGVFNKLTKLKTLNLKNNPDLSCLPFIPSSVTTLTLDKLRSAYAACGAGVTTSVPSFGAGAAIASQTLILNAPFSLTLPAPSGGSGEWTYTLTPALPRGLTFNPETRTLSGTPTQAQPATTYTYTATDADGNRVSLIFTMMVAADLQPTFGTHTIGDRTYEQHRAIETLLLPAATSGNGRLTYALTPAPPAGLTFDAATRTLSGTPSATQPATLYTYTVTDSDATDPDRATLAFRITVLTSTGKETLQDVLAAQGRALLSSATGVIGERFRNPGGVEPDGGERVLRRGSGAGRLHDRVAEHRGPGDAGDKWGGGDAPADSLALADVDETRPRGPGLTGTGARPAWDWESLLWGRSFALPLNPTASPGSVWTLWGAGDIQGFQGDPRQGNYDGQVRSLYLGVDAQWQEHWLAGAALARSWGKTDYVTERGGREGQLETTLLSVYPYVRGTLGAGLEVWAIGGYGRGDAENTRPVAGGAVETRDLTMAMGATGARQPMTEVGGVQLAVVGGAGYLSLATEGGDAVLADLDVAVNRARLAVEATYVAGGLAPYVQVGGRYDGGAGQTGAGLETVAGVRYTSARLAFEARGRWLATHAADGYKEYGGLVRLAVKPLADGTGFRLHVAPRWGAADGAELLGGGAALLDGGAMPGLAVNSVPSATNRSLVLDSELGYGFAVFEGYGLLTPYGGFASTGEETRQYRLGTRLGLAAWLNLSLEGSRREPAGPQPANQGVQLKLDGRF